MKGGFTQLRIQKAETHAYDASKYDLEVTHLKTAVSFFEQNGGTYTRVGDALLPNLALDKTESKPIGKYGRIRRRYLKEHRPAVYSLLLLNGELYGHLAEIDQTCEERIEQLARQMAEREGMTDPCACRAIMAPMCSASGRRSEAQKEKPGWKNLRKTAPQGDDPSLCGAVFIRRRIQESASSAPASACSGPGHCRPAR